MSTHGHEPTGAPSAAEAGGPRLTTYPRNFRKDLLSGFLVFLIALPLCLGIAKASDFPAIAGVLTAVVGGLVATFMGSAELTIKGPAAGLIVIALGAVQDLGQGDSTQGYRRAIAAVVVAGVFQVIFAWRRAGALGDAFPPSVVHGMLAAIGVIICSKQIHLMLGVTPHAKEPLELLAEIPSSIQNLNPEVLVIGGVSFLILLLMPRLPFAPLKKVPAPLFVLLTSIPLGAYFDLGHEHTYTFHNHLYTVGPKFLVSLPAHFSEAITFPDWSAITTGTSIKYIVMFTLVGSIESLLSAKAVDTLDPHKRQSNLNKDLLATGAGNVIAGLIGGLPMISEIVRSSANINNGASSRWSNFFHGLFLLLFVALLPGVLGMIPIAALSAMLVFTGTRLASPGLVKYAMEIGLEQLVVFMATLLITLATDLLVGVGSGMLLEALIYLARGASFGNLLRARAELVEGAGHTTVRVTGAALFTNFLSLRTQLSNAAARSLPVRVDVSQASYVDHTTVSHLVRLAEEATRNGQTLTVVGLDQLRPVSSHAFAGRRSVPAGARVAE